MKKLCVAVVGVLLLAFHLTSQVALANNGTNPDSKNITTPSPTGAGCGTTAAFMLLLPPLALTALLLHES